MHDGQCLTSGSLTRHQMACIHEGAVFLSQGGETKMVRLRLYAQNPSEALPNDEHLALFKASSLSGLSHWLAHSHAACMKCGSSTII